MAKANHTACSVDGCNGEHAARGYCHKHYVQSKRGTVRKDATICAHCGAGFTAKNVAAMYCSNKCKLAAWKINNQEKHKAHRLAEAEKVPKYSIVHFNTCVTCQCKFVSSRARMYCSDSCVPKPIYISIAPNEKTCANCGKRYAPVGTGGRPSEYCSDLCRDVAGRSAKRIDKAKRHALKRGATTERVDPFVVFDRDKWKCKLCGCKTPRSKRGTYDDDAPELDHIQPLSKGGEHSYRNTQCSCRKCNGLKSDTPRGQTLLFG